MHEIFYTEQIALSKTNFRNKKSENFAKILVVDITIK